MNNLINLIKKGESQTVEFKKSFAEQKEILQSICAFANMKGGKILIGVSDKSEIIGADIGKNTLEKIPQKIRETFDPVVFPSLVVEEIEGKNIVVVDVSESPEKPVFFKKDAYKRVGRANRKLSANEIRTLARKSGGEVYWDEQMCQDATLEYIDDKKVKWFLRKARKERNFDVDPETPTKDALERLKLIKQKGFTNAAVLLFAKYPQKFFLQAKIRCARFKGMDGDDYIDMKVLEGTIPELMENTIKFIMQHTKHGVFFDENRRYDRWEYPLRAFEELISNALAHREYNSPAQIQLSIFDDRIELWNPGELPEPLTPEDLKRKHRSIPRNRLTAENLFLIKYIEQWGRGTNRVIKSLLDHNLPEPVFQNLSGGFEVIVHGPGKEFEEEIEKEKYHILDINERQKRAIKYVKEKGAITRREYTDINDVSSKTAYLELNDLLGKKIFTLQGKGRATRYSLIR